MIDLLQPGAAGLTCLAERQVPYYRKCPGTGPARPVRHAEACERPFLLRANSGVIFTSRGDTALVRTYGLKQEFISKHPANPS